MIDPEKYNLIANTVDVQSYIYPKSYIFSVTNEDYDNGFARRYFVQKINGGPVLEVSQANYFQVPKSFYIKANIMWFLIGPSKNVYSNGKLYETGVYEKNLQEINEAAKTMPSMKNFITDFIQFNKTTKS